MSSGQLALRFVVAVIGLGLLAWSYVLHQEGVPTQATWVLMLDGALIIVGTIFERQRYRPNVDTSKGVWTHTGEKFKDPTTGKLMEVLYNAKTGERDYVEL